MADHPPGTLLWQLVISQEISSIKCENVYHFTNVVSMTDEQLPAFTQRVHEDFSFSMFADITAVQSFGVLWTKATVTCLIPHSGPFSVFDYGPTSNGAVQSEPLATFNAMVISKQTGFSGRTNRGRLYIPGVSVIDALLNDLTDDAFARLQTIAFRLLQVFGVNGTNGTFRIVLYSHKDGDSADGATIFGVKPITKFNAHQQLFTQRHRLKGVGI